MSEESSAISHAVGAAPGPEEVGGGGRTERPERIPPLSLSMPPLLVAGVHSRPVVKMFCFYE
jgi:hypothetical protein